MIPKYELWSDELKEMLAALPLNRAAAIPRVVIHVGNGGSVKTLLTGDDRIISPAQYARWKQDPAFSEALALAEVEYGRYLAGDAVKQSAEDLRALTRDATEYLRMCVRAGRGEKIERGPLATLQASADKGNRVAARDLARLAEDASKTALDRADVETAVKQTGTGPQAAAELYREQRAADEMAELESEDEGI